MKHPLHVFFWIIEAHSIQNGDQGWMTGEEREATRRGLERKRQRCNKHISIEINRMKSDACPAPALPALLDTLIADCSCHPPCSIAVARTGLSLSMFMRNAAPQRGRQAAEALHTPTWAWSAAPRKRSCSRACKTGAQKGGREAAPYRLG